MEINIKYEFDNHRGIDVILIRFERNQVLNERVRKLVGVKWSNSKKAWYVQDSAFYREKFKLTSQDIAGKKVYPNVVSTNDDVPQKVQSAFYREKSKSVPKEPVGKEVLSNLREVNYMALQKYVLMP